MKKLFLIILSAFLVSCDEHENHNHENDHNEHEAHNHENESSLVRFDEAHGLEFSEEIADALKIKTQKIIRQDLNVEIILAGQVIASGTQTQVNVKVPLECFESLKNFTFKHGKLIHSDKFAGEISGLADLIYQFDKIQDSQSGDFANIELEQLKKSVLVIPEIAVLKTVNGEYVYVSNGESFRRTEIKTSEGSAGFLEIKEGLDEGETIVVMPVLQLWLIELKLTKGGGHSH